LLWGDERPGEHGALVKALTGDSDRRT